MNDTNNETNPTPETTNPAAEPPTTKWARAREWAVWGVSGVCGGFIKLLMGICGLLASGATKGWGLFRGSWVEAQLKSNAKMIGAGAGVILGAKAFSMGLEHVYYAQFNNHFGTYEGMGLYGLIAFLTRRHQVKGAEGTKPPWDGEAMGRAFGFTPFTLLILLWILQRVF